MAILPGTLFKDSQSKNWNEWVESVWQLFQKYLYIVFQMPLLQVKNLAKLQIKDGRVILDRAQFLCREKIGWQSKKNGTLESEIDVPPWINEASGKFDKKNRLAKE